MVKKKRYSLSNVQFETTTKYLFIGYTVVLTSAWRNFRIWMWVNSVLYSGYRNERRKLYFSWLFSNIV